jgi:hypothetical protein
MLKILWGEAKLCAALPDRRGVALRDLQPTSRTRLDYRHNSKKGQAWNKCALLTRGKPSNRRKLRILLHSFPAGFTSQACNSPPLIWPDTGSGGFFDRTRRLCSLARAKGSAVFSPKYRLARRGQPAAPLRAGSARSGRVTPKIAR